LCLEIFGVLQLDINLDSVEWNLSGINELLDNTRDIARGIAGDVARDVAEAKIIEILKQVLLHTSKLKITFN